MAKKKITMKCGEVEKSLSIDHAERVLGNPKSSKNWKIVDKDYKIKDGKIISNKSKGADKGSSE
jgi:hypothetical protein